LPPAAEIADQWFEIFFILKSSGWLSQTLTFLYLRLASLEMSKYPPEATAEGGKKLLK
jgi:hypothetical protein